MEPLRDWLSDYLEYSKLNECPKCYHYWVALGILSGAVRRNIRVMLPNAYKPLYLSLYIILIGDSGSGKSTAISYGKNLLKKVPGTLLLPDKGSMEAFVNTLATPLPFSEEVKSQGTLLISELVNFLDKQKHNAGMVPFLLDMTDCHDDWEYKTNKGGSVLLKDVAVTMVAASAPDLFFEAIPPLALKSGFMARILCVPQEYVGTFFPFVGGGDPEAERLALNGLLQRAQMGGQIILSKVVEKMFIEWYVAHKTNQRSQTDLQKKFDAYDSRKSVHLLRIASLIELARNTIGFVRNERGTLTLEVGVKAFEEALKELLFIEKALPKIYTGIAENTVGLMTESEAADLIIGQLIKAPQGIMGHSALLKALFHALKKATTLESALRTLIGMGEIELYKTKSGGKAYKLVKFNRLQRGDNPV